MDKDLEYIQNAIETSPEEYHRFLEENGELLSAEDYSIIYQAEQMDDYNFGSGC